MDYNLKKEHLEIREKVRAFAESEIAPVASKLDENAEFSPSLTMRMGELGLMGMYLPAEYGGANTDTLSYIIAIEELSRVDSSQAATLAAHNSLGIGPIYEFGTEEQKKQYLPELCTGKSLWGFALTEKNAGSDARGTETQATTTENQWKINGEKLFITNTGNPLSAGVTLQAVTYQDENRHELTAILIPSGTIGFTAHPMRDKMMWRASSTARLIFNNCMVPVENTLGKPGQGARIMLQALNNGRLSIAAMGLGIAQGAFEQALSYSKTRKQFGQTIFRNQAIAFRLGELAMKIEHARLFLYQACRMKDEGKNFIRESAMTKLYTSELAKEVADFAIQVHGGIGLLKGHPVERFYRDQRILQIGEGTSEIQKLIISRML